MDQRQAAIDRLTERLTGVWAKAMLDAHGKPDDFGFRLKHAMAQTEALARQFCEYVDKPTENGKPAPAGQRRQA